MCYVVRVAPSSKVWCFFVFYVSSEGLSSSLFFCGGFRPFSKVGNSQLHNTRFDYLRSYGILIQTYVWLVSFVLG